MSEPETVTITVPWEAAQAMAEWSLWAEARLTPMVEACRDATKPKPTPRFMLEEARWWWWLRDMEVGGFFYVATFYKDHFTEDYVKAVCKKLNEGER